MGRGQEQEAGGPPRSLAAMDVLGSPRGCSGGGTPGLCTWTPQGLLRESDFGAHPGGSRRCHLRVAVGWAHPGGGTLRILGGPTWVSPWAPLCPRCQVVQQGHPGENAPGSRGHCGGFPGVWGSSWGSRGCPHRQVLQQILQTRGRGAAVAAELAPHRLLRLPQQLLGFPHLSEELGGGGSQLWGPSLPATPS